MGPQQQQSYDPYYASYNPQQQQGYQQYATQTYQQQQISPQGMTPDPEHAAQEAAPKKKLNRWTQDTFLLTVIILNIMDFFEILPGDLDFAKKILSWLCLGYLLYHVNIAQVIFGKGFKELSSGFKVKLRRNDINIILLISYFLLIFKNLVYFAGVTIHEGVALTTVSAAILGLMAEHSLIINSMTMLAGGIMLLLISLIMSLRYTIAGPSIMATIHEKGAPPQNIVRMILRFLLTYLVLIGFYIIVFNFFMEWLAFAIDSFILVLGIIIYLFVIVRGKDRYSSESVLSKIGSFGNDFYQKFIELFYTRKGLALGLTGILVLHLIVELGTFIVPYIIGIQDTLYFSTLEQIYPGTHLSIYSQLTADIAINTVLLEKIATVGVYALNIIGVLLLLIVPAYLWYKSFLSKGISVPRVLIALLFASLAALVLGRIFDLKRIAHPQHGLAGVDIQTTTIISFFGISPLMILLICAVIFMMVFYVTKSSASKEHFIIFGAVIISLVILFYIILFAWDLLSFYLFNLSIMLDASSEIGHIAAYVNYFYMLMFAVMTFLFYVSSFIIFVRETITELHLTR